jgi:hypothetical protein
MKNYELIKTEKHILVISNDEIAIGDFVIVRCSELDITEVNKVNGYYNEQFLFEGRSQIHMDYCKKIIAHITLNKVDYIDGIDFLIKQQ